MTPKENFLRAVRRSSPAWVPNGMESVATIRCPVVERPRQAGKDAFGVEWLFNPLAEGGTYPAPHGETIHDFECWREELTLPDIDAADWAKVKKEADSIDRDTTLVSGFVEMGLFERSYLLLGMEEALCRYITDEDEMRALAHTLADYKIRIIEYNYEYLHPDMIWYGDDWGTQRNTFLPPETWRRVIRPETQRIYDSMKRFGILINQHSCGYIEPLVGDIRDMGADMLNPCQPCNDLGLLKRLYGDSLCFIGGIDSQFVLNRPGVTPEEVDREVRRRMEEMKAGGGYVAMPSHNVPYDPSILRAMEDAIHAYGKY